MTHNGHAPGSRTRALAAAFGHGPPSHIPLPRHARTSQGDPTSPRATSRFYCDEDTAPRLQSSTASLKLRTQVSSEDVQVQGDSRWKARYEEVERKRKSLLTQSQRVERENGELQKRHQDLSRDYSSVKRQLSDKEEKLNHLRKVSEAVYREYDLLKNKYEVDQRVMQDAMNSASQWYKQNRQLKRKSAALTQKFLQVSAGSIVDSVDGEDGDLDSKDGDELETLRNIIKEMSQEVARLQADLNAARLQEFEAQEQTVNLSAELEEERHARQAAELELQELRTMRENMSRVSRLVALEMTSLREQCQQEKEVALRMKTEADKAQKERNVLAHQSIVLMSDVVGDDKLMRVLQEMEDLRRTLEEERQKYKADLQELQDKLEENEEEAQLELLEEKLKLAESELQCALQRAERAECHSTLLSSKIGQLEDEVQTLKCPQPPPPPPPPPPSPPLPGGSLSSPSSNSSSGSAAAGCDVNPVLEMANILGIPRKTSTLVAATPGGAIDDIINQIKGGKFTLKRPERPTEKKKEEETPAAVKEMLSIIGTLKRRPKARQPLPADVAL